MTTTLTRGTQILYVPMHAQGDTNHPDVEPGFVTSQRGDVVFCRYWSKHAPGELRTKANSEATPVCRNRGALERTAGAGCRGAGRH